jgi:hypothetical protein
MLAPNDVSVNGTAIAQSTPLPKPRPKELGPEEVMAKGKPAAAADKSDVTSSTPHQ